MDLENKIVDTLMGECGTSGFADGYRTGGLLNKPKNLGFDRQERIYVYDSGNSYIRILQLPNDLSSLENIVSNTKLMSLKHGSCFEIASTYTDNFPKETDF